MIKVYRKLLYYVPEKRMYVFFSLILTTISTAMTILGFYFMYKFLYELVVTEKNADAFTYAVVIMLLFVVGGLLYFTAVILTHVVGFRLEANLRKKGVEGLMASSFKFFDLNSSGRTRHIIDNNASKTHTIVAHLLPDNMGAIVTPILAMILGFMVDLRVGIALVAVTLIGVISIKGMMGDNEYMKIYTEMLEKMSGETVEYVRGIQVVKIFGAKLDSFKRLYETITVYAKMGYDYSMSCKKAYVFFQAIFFGFVAIVLPAIVIFTDISKAPKELVVNFIMLLFLSGLMFTGLMKIMYVSMYAFQGVDAVEKLEEIFNSMQEDKLNYGNIESFESFNIEFDNVCFAYNDNQILKNISFSLEAGKSYALVGSSGGGKSTIAKLISGFYNVTSGQVKIGGKNILDYSEDAITRNIAFVFQDSKLFKKTIFDNVKLARETASDEEVFKALSLAGCDSLLSKLPDAERTVIGAKGIFLSGGEKQRIAIARAILKDASIIIMDEASAAIDPENEHELQKAFKNLIKGKTVIMIAHRLSSIRATDEILVIENGNIVERGSDDILMQKSGKYKFFQDLYKLANDWRVKDEQAI